MRLHVKEAVMVKSEAPVHNGKVDVQPCWIGMWWSRVLGRAGLWCRDCWQFLTPLAH